MLKVGAVAKLLFFGETEEVLGDGELAVDLFLGQAEIGDVAGVVSADIRRTGTGEEYKKPTLCTASSSCFASFCFPPGASIWDRSRVTRSAQSTGNLSAWISCFAGFLTFRFRLFRLMVRGQNV